MRREAINRLSMAGYLVSCVALFYHTGSYFYSMINDIELSNTGRITTEQIAESDINRKEAESASGLSLVAALAFTPGTIRKVWDEGEED